MSVLRKRCSMMDVMICVGLIVLGLCLDNGLTNIARAIEKRKEEV